MSVNFSILLFITVHYVLYIVATPQPLRYFFVMEGLSAAKVIFYSLYKYFYIIFRIIPREEIWRTEDGADGKNAMQLTGMC